MDENQQDITEIIQERMKELPAPVQRAIRSASVEARLRTLSDEQRLHIDQWQVLENEVMLTLFGFQPLAELAKNIQESVGVDTQTAQTLAAEIERAIFAPVREELERELEHPEAKDKELTTTEKAREAISVEHATTQPTTPVAPSVPGVVRAPVSEIYKPGEPSVARKGSEGDPYREPVA